MSRYNGGEKNIYYIENVPFFKQKKYQCGPSALTSVLNYYGKNLTLEEVTELLTKEQVRGTLTLEMLLLPRRFGLVTELLVDDLDMVKDYIKKRIPVILLVDNGFLNLRIPHYVVIIGYDALEQVFVAHWGDERDKIIGEKELLRRWKRMNSWGFATKNIPEDEMTAEQFIERGLAMENAGDLELAEKDYKRAVELNNQLCAPQFNLGNVYYKKGDYDASVEWFKKALEICIKKGDVLNNLAYVLMKMGKTSEAIEYINRALAIEPDNPEYIDTKRRIEGAGKY